MRLTRCLTTCLPAFAIALTSPAVAVDVVHESARIVPENVNIVDYFGQAVAVKGGVAVVGAPRADWAGEDSGSAFVFRLVDGQWREEAELRPFAESHQRAGSAVAVAPPYAFVGAPMANAQGVPDVGVVYVYRYGAEGWREHDVLHAPNEELARGFGSSLATDGERLVVGMANGWYEPEVWLFRHDDEEFTWDYETAIAPDAGAATDHFGTAIAMADGYVAVGAPQRGAGAVHVFRHDGGNDWREEATLVAHGVTEDARFGASVAIDDAFVLAGAPYDDTMGDGNGSAHMFGRHGLSWTRESVLVADHPRENANFGYSVALGAGRALVAGPRLDGRTIVTGAVISYARAGVDGGTWVPVAVVTASDGDVLDRFGYGLALDGAVAIAGAFGRDDARGAAYIVRDFDGADCNANGIPDPVELAEGTSEDVNRDGTPDECQCIADVDASGGVAFGDLVMILGGVGACAPEGDCPADIDADGVVSFTDLLIVIEGWGVCGG